MTTPKEQAVEKLVAVCICCMETATNRKHRIEKARIAINEVLNEYDANLKEGE